MKKLLTSAVLLLGLFGTAWAADSSQPQFSEGNGYHSIVPAQPTSAAPGQVEVIEFFWFGCPHCFALEPYVENWDASKPANVKFVRIPGVIAPNWETDARAFYVAQTLGIADKIQEPLFNAIHLDHNLALLNNEDAIAKFFSKYGVTEDQVKSAWHSFAVDTRIREAKVIEKRYQISGVPTLVVNGKYMTGAGEPGVHSYAEIMQVVQYLVKKELAHQPPGS